MKKASTLVAVAIVAAVFGCVASAECSSDDDCAVGVCNAGSCVDCEDDDDCDDGEVCANDECVEGASRVDGEAEGDAFVICCYDALGFECAGSCPDTSDAAAADPTCDDGNDAACARP
jgi:hypothetical protein